MTTKRYGAIIRRLYAIFEHARGEVIGVLLQYSTLSRHELQLELGGRTLMYLPSTVQYRLYSALSFSVCVEHGYHVESERAVILTLPVALPVVCSNKLYWWKRYCTGNRCLTLRYLPRYSQWYQRKKARPRLILRLRGASGQGDITSQTHTSSPVIFRIRPRP